MVAYIVSGETGEYEDHREWAVAVFTDKAVAEGLKTLLIEQASVLRYMDYTERRKAISSWNGFDKSIQYDQGVFYYVEEAPLNPEF